MSTSSSAANFLPELARPPEGAWLESAATEERLRHLETLVLGASDGIVITDAGDAREPFPRIVYVNEGFTRLTGYSQAEMIGRSPRMLQGPDTDPATVAEIGRAIAERRKIRCELLNYAKDGSAYWVECDIHPILTATGACTHFIAIERDVTDRKRLESALMVAKEQAEAANMAKSQFLMTMSHELRTPLNAILGFSELLGREVFGPLGHARYREHVAAIHESGQRLFGLVADLLDVAAIDTGALDLARAPVAVAKVIADVLRAATPLAADKGIRLCSDIAPDLPVITGDARRLRQALGNLLSNGIKFTAGPGRVDIAAWAEREMAVIEITDEGMGMAPDLLRRIEAPFVHAEPSATKTQGGCGTGLYIARAIIAAHGGRVTIESQPGRGTTVRLQLPVAAE